VKNGNASKDWTAPPACRLRKKCHHGRGGRHQEERHFFPEQRGGADLAAVHAAPARERPYIEQHSANGSVTAIGLDNSAGRTLRPRRM
jgi:hypothetical protein